MKSVLIVLSLLVLILGNDAQCIGRDEANCEAFRKIGFCFIRTIPLEARKRTCGVACGFCNTDGSQTARGGGRNYPPCVDENRNCASLATGGYCTRPNISNAEKLRGCCNTCRPFLFSGIFLTTTSTRTSTRVATTTTPPPTTTTTTTTTTTLPPTTTVTTTPAQPIAETTVKIEAVPSGDRAEDHHDLSEEDYSSEEHD